MPIQELPEVAATHDDRSRNRFTHHLDNPTADEMHRYLGESLEEIAALTALLGARYLGDPKA